MEPGSIVSHLADASVRSACLGLVALLALWAARPRSAAVRHAVWTLVLCGMLLLPAAWWLPGLPLRILPSASPAAPLVLGAPPMVATPSAPVAPVPHNHNWPGWREIAAAIYLAGAAVFAARLLFGYLFTRRLVRGSTPVENTRSAVPLRESRWISVPMTVGFLRPRILLPVEWHDWDAAKLEAVLVHESNHVRRRDWLVTLLAGANKAVFWFHPLAWWVERRLATLAELACDDSALLALGDRDQYARTLLDMAAAVRSGQGRLTWDALAMAKPSLVRQRIERVLDDSRTLSRGLTKRGWATLALTAVPLAYGAAAVRFQTAQSPAAGPEFQVAAEGDRLTAAEAQRLEGYLAANPEDLEARTRLISYYFLNGIREPRLTHIYWMIEHHPEAEMASYFSTAISPRATPLNTEADYERARSLWQEQVRRHADDPRVLGNAARFFFQPGGGVQAAEDLLKQSHRMEPRNSEWVQRLSALYLSVIADSVPEAGAMKPFADSAMAARFQSELEASNDALLVMYSASRLVSMVRQRPALAPLSDFVERLEKRAGQLGAVRTLPQAADYFQAQPGGQTVKLVTRVAPDYPTLARQARIQGTVRMKIAIGTDGHVENIQLISGHPLLVPAAQEAVKKWVYEPLPQPVTTTVDVPFTLPPREPAPAVTAAPPLPPPPGSAPMRIRVGPNVQASKLVSKPEPVYPPLARQARIQGTVRFRLTIAPDGRVSKAELIDGHPLLAPAAYEAVRKYQYQPTLLNGNAVEVVSEVDVPFLLPPQ